MADKYVSEDAAVQALRPGWKIVGRETKTAEVDNPARTTPGPDGKIDPLAPPKISVPIGTVLSIEGPNGEPDKMTVSNLSAADFTDPNRQSGPALSVLEGPAKGPPTTATGNKPSDPNKWTAVPRPGTTDTVGLWDPINSEWHPLAAVPGAQPSGKFEPAIVTQADGTQREIGTIDTGDKSFHPTPTPPSPQPSGKYDNKYIQNADGSQRLVGMTDTGDKHFIPVSADPTTQKRTIQTPTAVYSVDDNDNVKKLFDVDKSSPYQATIIDGVPYSFDPNEKDPNKRFTKAPGDWEHPPIKDANQTPMQWQADAEGGGKYVYPPGVQPPGALNTNTTAKTLDWYDAQGNLLKSQPNPNYLDPKLSQQPQLQAPNTTAPMIMVADPDHPGQTKWIKNEGRVTASQALQQLASQLSGHVVDGNISVDEAKQIIDGANSAMATAAQGAQASLSAINQGATAGANVLNQRAQTAQNLVQQGQGLLSQTKHGLLTAPGADFGQNLVQGAAGFATELGGGPDVYQAAANLVRRADPNGTQGQDAASAYSTLSQMFQKYRQANGGEPHPAEVAALQGGPGVAGGQQVNNQVFQSAPFNPQASTAGMNAAGFPDTPAGRAAAMAATPSLLQTPTPPYQVPVQAAAQNAGFQAPFSGSVTGQNYGPATAYSGGVSPWNALPGPSFVAPPSMPGLPPSSQHITITVPTGAGG